MFFWFLELASLHQNLDNSEIELFEIGKQTSDEFKKWENRSLEKLTANEMVTKLKKRKRAALD